MLGRRTALHVALVSSMASPARREVKYREGGMDDTLLEPLSGLDDNKHLFRERALLALGRMLEAGESSVPCDAVGEIRRPPPC